VVVVMDEIKYESMVMVVAERKQVVLV